jgi:hypothetical protein
MEALYDAFQYDRQVAGQILTAQVRRAIVVTPLTVILGVMHIPPVPVMSGGS